MTRTVTIGRALPVLALLLSTGCAQPTDPRPAPPMTAAPLPAVAQPAPGPVQPPPQPGRTVYRCDTGEAVVVQDEGDTMRLSGLPRGEEQLDRDAGGLTPQQAVFTGPTLRAEFGLDADGRGLALQSLSPPGQLHCRRN